MVKCAYITATCQISLILAFQITVPVQGACKAYIVLILMLISMNGVFLLQ